jgi:hypothetical protein
VLFSRCATIVDMKKWIVAFQVFTFTFTWLDLMGVIPHNRAIKFLAAVALPVAILAFIRQCFYMKNAN